MTVYEIVILVAAIVSVLSNFVTVIVALVSLIEYKK
jgi:hypothetical protein